MTNIENFAVKKGAGRGEAFSSFLGVRDGAALFHGVMGDYELDAKAVEAKAAACRSAIAFFQTLEGVAPSYRAGRIAGWQARLIVLEEAQAALKNSDKD